MNHFIEVYKRVLKGINAEARRMIILWGKEELVCEVIVDGRPLEYVWENKYSKFVLDESGTTEINVVGKWQVGGNLRVAE